MSTGVSLPPVSDVRARLRAMWAAAAPGWAQYSDYVDRRTAVATPRMLELAGIHEGQRVLELAAGPGGLGLVAARVVGPSGQVVISDLVHEMTSIAAARAAMRGLDNVTTIELDLEQIDQPSQSFDAVLCREGLMLVPDPAAAMREIARVLRPGGRAMVSVWGPQDHNPWLGLIFQAVSEVTGRPTPQPGLPMPFSLGSIQHLTAIVTSALDEVTVEELSVPLQDESFAEYWNRTTALAGPLSKILAELPPPVLDRIWGRLEELVAPYSSGEGIAIPGLMLLAAGRRSYTAAAVRRPT